MANYIKGEKNYYPDIKPFTPDYKFLSAALDARENKYNAGWQATNDLYSRVYSDLSHSDNKEFQQQFIENLAPELSRISGLDLSLQTNVDAAKSVFAPFFEDEAVVKDIVYTSTYKKELQRANQFADSPDPRVRELYNPVGIKNMQYRMQEFQEADRNQLINMPLPKYVEDADLTQYAQEYLRGLGLEGKGFTQKKDHFTMDAGADGVPGTPDDRVVNRWIITDSNGKLIEGDAYRRVMTDLTDDPRVQEFYNAKAYVASMDFATQGIQDGSIKTITEGLAMWSDAEVKRLALANSERYNSLDNEIQRIVQQTTNWGNFGKLNGLTPAEQNLVGQSLSEAEQLRVNLSNLLKVNEFANTPDKDDQALINKAYSLNSNYNISQDLQSAAYNYSRENAETVIRENDYIINEDKHKFALQEIAAKYNADAALKDQQAGIDANLEILKAQLKPGEIKSLTEQAQESGVIDYSDPRANLNVIVDGEVSNSADPYDTNADMIATDGQNILEEKARMLGQMLKARYPDQQTFTVTLDGEMLNLSPSDITARLLRKKEIIDGTKVTEDLNKLKYETDILRMYEEQSKWFGNKDAVIAQHTPAFVKPGSQYDVMYKLLFGNDPNNPEALGLNLREDIYLQRIEKYDNELYNKAKTAEAKILEGTTEWKKEMIKANYPKPYIEENGIKRFMTFSEYQKLFKDQALAGKIKNFDVSGIGGAENTGSDREDWTRIQTTGSVKVGNYKQTVVIDEAAIAGKSKALWQAYADEINSSYETIGGNSYLSLTAGYSPNAPWGNIGFVPTMSATGSVQPEAGSAMDKVLGTALNQLASSTADPETRVSFLPAPKDIKEFNNFNIEAGVDLSEEQNIIAKKIFTSLQNRATKGEFTMTYYPNLGATKVDDEDRNPMGGYKIDNFSTAFKNEIKKIYKDDSESLKDWNQVMNQGVLMVFDRSGNKDINPNNLNILQGSSYIEQMMNLSNTQSFSYKDETNLTAGFSPGEIVFQDLGDGTISISGYTNVYNPNSTDVSMQYTRQPMNAAILKKGNINYAADLNSRFIKLQQNFKELDRLNNLAIYQVRAKQLSETKFIEDYMLTNPGSTTEQAKDMYNQAKNYKPQQ
ncbi:MAG: hypothetical protein CMJ25_22530 [Phycisphaerae bacterium]|nr:hypothetical protein [Phycisphaerae bacterium]